MENAAPASGAAAFDRMRVLAVDEDPHSLMTLTQMLQRCGHRVTPKASPEEALKEVRLNTGAPYDLVMSVARTRGVGIDGFALLKHLKNRLPVILISDENEPVEKVSTALMGGACYFMYKPLQDMEIHNIWKHVARWRRNAAHGGDPRKRGSGGVVNRSGEGGSRGIQQQQQKQCRTTVKTRFNEPPHLHATVVTAAEQLLGTEGYCPRGIRELLLAQGVEVTIEQVTCHLKIYERDCVTNNLSIDPMDISSHYNNSKNYLTPGSSGSYMRTLGATNINQTSLPSNGALPVGHAVHGNESYGASHVGYLHNNGNANGYGNHYVNRTCNGKYGNGHGNHYGSSTGNCNANANANANVYYGNGPASPANGLPANGSMASASPSSNLAQQVQQPMPTTGLFPRLSYNSSTGGITMSPWDEDDGADLLRSYLGTGEKEVMQNTAATGMTQRMHEDGAAGQTSGSQPQDLTDYFSWDWESTNGNGTTGASGGM